MAKAKKQYRVMIAIANDETGKRFVPGDTVTVDDFDYAQIKEWQMMTPPVLVDNDIYLASLPLEKK